MGHVSAEGEKSTWTNLVVTECLGGSAWSTGTQPLLISYTTMARIGDDIVDAGVIAIVERLNHEGYLKFSAVYEPLGPDGSH
jgi:hypothetical protein